MPHKTDLNHASKDELMQVPGIGETLAQGIIDYREEHAGFESVDELDHVGIFAKQIIDRIKPNVTVRH